MAKKGTGKSAFRKILTSLVAMAVIVVLLVAATMRWIRSYTMHGQYIEVPDVCGLDETDAAQALARAGLVYEISDVRFAPNFEPGQIIEQKPDAMAYVKQGRTVYLSVNSGNQPMKAIPDLADNSSLRSAQARLTAMGFTLTETEYTTGDKDWVYAIKMSGRELHRGALVPEGSRLTIVAGNGEDESVIADADSSQLIQSDFFDSEY